MPAKTNTERIQETWDLLNRHISATAHKFDGVTTRLSAFSKKLDETDSQLQIALQKIAVLEQQLIHAEAQLQSVSPARVAVLEQRITQLEKHSDRGWQIWLAILAGFIGMLVAILKH